MNDTVTLKINRWDALEAVRKLHKYAMPFSDDDYQSERQVDCENAFFEMLEMLDVDLGDNWDTWVLKATTEEYLDEALNRAEIKLLYNLDPAEYRGADYGED